MKNSMRIVTISSFVVVLVLIAFFVVIPKDFFEPKKQEFQESRMVTPSGSTVAKEDLDFKKSQTYYETSVRPRINLEEGEIIAIVLTDNFDNNPDEEQIISYRNLKVENSPIYITYVSYEALTKTYKRQWSLSTPITQSSTLSMYSEDLLGDRSKCIIVTGMNNSAQRIMNIYRYNTASNAFDKIYDITIDGTISVVESERTQAYHLGMTNGQSYKISAHGRDLRSANPLDQIERIFAYNEKRNIFEEESVNKIPGAQVEAQKLKGLLNGNSSEFEQFIQGLWYRINQDGTVDNRRYVYFDTNDREVIFYDEDTQQVYNWLGSNATRYGLYISSQNISVSTLRRIMDIELESLDSIRIKVFEDVHMKILIDAPWDGSYRKAKSSRDSSKNTKHTAPFIDARYLSTLGSVVFSPEGNYEITQGENTKKGKYIFFMLEDNEFLEMIPENPAGESSVYIDGRPKNFGRETFLVERSEKSPLDFSLNRVKLTIRGLQEFHEAPIMFNAESYSSF
ncbi:MAG: hypothetical protein Ta2G_09200 [Termitinemataceae bacterium]|nr:MAG: hypothetical protein Ta2G_09200 [Termitinemataceae bacterium]